MKYLAFIVPVFIAFATPVCAQESEQQVLAQQIAAKMLPDGTYQTMMKAVTDQFTNQMMDQALNLPLSDIAGLAGLSGASQEKVVKASKVTLRQIAVILDPAFAERTRIRTQVMMTEMGALLSTMEPEYRAGLAEALAANFTTAQLHDLETFFSTPTGSVYASKLMRLYTSPEMMQRMQTMMPKLMAKMPEIIAKMQAATADLPKPRNPADLTPQQIQQLKALLDVPDPK